MANQQQKQPAQAKIGKKSLYDQLYSKEDVEKSKKTLATGGGEPIPKGQKMTDEKRVLQPRDPETGQFDYNASADIERKYEYHAERNGLRDPKDWNESHRRLPKALQQVYQDFFQDDKGNPGIFSEEGVREGQKMSANGQRFIASLEMDKKEFIDLITSVSHDEEGKAHLSSKTYDSKGAVYKEKTKESAFVSADTRGKKPAKSSGADWSSLKSVNPAEMKESLAKAAKAARTGLQYENNPDFIAPIAPELSPDKKAKNEAYNNMKQQPQQKPEAAPIPSVEPKQEPEKKPYSFDANEAEKDPKGYYEANKEDIDKAVKAFNEKHGKNINAAQYIKAKINKAKATAANKQ